MISGKVVGDSAAYKQDFALDFLVLLYLLSLTWVIAQLLGNDDILFTTNDLGLFHDTKKSRSNNFDSKDMIETF